MSNNTNRASSVPAKVVYGLIALFVLFILLLSLTGCMDKEAMAAQAAEKAEKTEVTPPPIDKNVHQFGELHVYDDGITILVDEPIEFELSESGEVEGTLRAHQLVFRITIKNGSSENFQPQAFPKVTSGEFEGSLIYDVNNPIGDFTYDPGLPIPPGEESVMLVAYSVDDPSHVTVRIAADFDHDDLRFTNVAP